MSWILILSLIQCSDAKCSTKEIAHSDYVSRDACNKAGKEVKETFSVLYTKVEFRCTRD